MDKLHEEKLRAEFEKQIREDLLFDDEELEWQPERNCYAIYGVHLAWWGYRASRVNLVVELPDPMTEVVADTLIHGRVMANDMRTACAKSLRSIGLSIKGE